MRRTIGVAFLVGGLLRAEGAVAQSLQNVVLRNSFSPIGAGARGLGMGGAFIAVADDGTADSFTPAGPTQLRRTEFAVVGVTDLHTSDLTGPKGPGTVTTSNHAPHKPPAFGDLALPFTCVVRL